MSKQSKVTVAYLVTDENGNPKSWNGKHGMMYFHFIEMQNGDKGEYMSKSQTQTKFVIGQDANYEFTPSTNPQHANKIKPVSEGFQGGKKAIDPKTMYASYAKDILVAYINNGHKVEQSWFIAWADYIEAWVNGKSATPPQVQQPTQSSEDPTDDLPF